MGPHKTRSPAGEEGVHHKASPETARPHLALPMGPLRASGTLSSGRPNRQVRRWHDAVVTERAALKRGPRGSWCPVGTVQDRPTRQRRPGGVGRTLVERGGGRRLPVSPICRERPGTVEENWRKSPFCRRMGWVLAKILVRGIICADPFALKNGRWGLGVRRLEKRRKGVCYAGNQDRTDKNSQAEAHRPV